MLVSPSLGNLTVLFYSINLWNKEPTWEGNAWEVHGPAKIGPPVLTCYKTEENIKKEDQLILETPIAYQLRSKT